MFRNHDGIGLDGSNNNTILYNRVLYNGREEYGFDDFGEGIGLYISSNNKIMRNNFTNNALQVRLDDESQNNIWDGGSASYSSGGNYWSNYTGKDEKSGPNQDQPGSDGIGDTAHPIYIRIGIKTSTLS